jgi:hypothetical protein
VLYIAGISDALINIKKFLRPTAPIFIVANDSRNLNRTIARKSRLYIGDIFYSQVLNRMERDKQPNSESIFQMSCR